MWFRYTDDEYEPRFAALGAKSSLRWVLGVGGSIDMILAGASIACEAGKARLAGLGGGRGGNRRRTHGVVGNF